MQMRDFTVPLSNGNVAAIITSAEFIVGTVAIYCTYPIMRGLWLLQLHRNRRLAVRIQERKYRRIKNEILALTIAVLFATTVALFESNLGQRYYISSKEKFSKYCAPMATASDVYLLSKIRAPTSFKIDTVSSEIAASLDCEFGLNSVEFGSEIVAGEYSTNFFVPICNGHSENNESGSASGAPYFPRSNMQKQFIEYSDYTDDPIDYIEMDLYSRPFFVIPYNVTTFGKTRKDLLNSSHVIPKIPACEERKISSIPTVSNRWEIRQVDDMFIWRVILERLCEQHSGDASASVSNDTISECEGAAELNATCINSGVSRNEASTFEFTIDDVAVLAVVDDNWNATSYACTNASVKIEYELISENHVRNITEYGAPLVEDRSIVIITVMEVISGRCELAQHTLGLFAVLYSARVEWFEVSKQFFSHLTRHQTYYAYVMSIARSGFPFEELDSPVFKNNQTCPFHIAAVGTVIESNAFLWSTLTIFAVGLLLIICSSLFLTVFSKQAWHFASYTEKLESLSSEFQSSASVTFNNFYNKKVTKILTCDVEETEASRSPNSDFLVIVDDPREFEEQAKGCFRPLSCSSYRIETFGN